MNIPATLLQVGSSRYSDKTDGSGEFHFTLTNSDDWPTDGDVCKLTVEVSPDGQNWQFDAGMTLGGIWKDRQGNVIHSAPWNIFGVDRSMSDVRITIEMLQTATLGISL